MSIKESENVSHEELADDILNISDDEADKGIAVDDSDGESDSSIDDVFVASSDSENEIEKSADLEEEMEEDVTYDSSSSMEAEKEGEEELFDDAGSDLEDDEEENGIMVASDSDYSSLGEWSDEYSSESEEEAIEGNNPVVNRSNSKVIQNSTTKGSTNPVVTADIPKRDLKTLLYEARKVSPEKVKDIKATFSRNRLYVSLKEAGVL